MPSKKSRRSKTPKTATCRTCRKRRPLSEFSRTGGAAKGHQRDCQACMSKKIKRGREQAAGSKVVPKGPCEYVSQLLGGPWRTSPRTG